MGEIILTQLLTDAGVTDVVVESGGTGDWHVGETADPRAIAVLNRHGYDGSTHRAQQFTRDWFTRSDLVLAADEGHVRVLRRMAPDSEAATKVRLLREFDEAAVAAGTLEVDDPWYSDFDAFERCFAEVEAACRGLVRHLTTAGA